MQPSFKVSFNTFVNIFKFRSTAASSSMFFAILQPVPVLHLEPAHSKPPFSRQQAYAGNQSLSLIVLVVVIAIISQNLNGTYTSPTSILVQLHTYQPNSKTDLELLLVISSTVLVLVLAVLLCLKRFHSMMQASRITGISSTTTCSPSWSHFPLSYWNFANQPLLSCTSDATSVCSHVTNNMQENLNAPCLHIGVLNMSIELSLKVGG